MSDAASPSSFRPGAVWRDTAGVPINAHGGGILFHEGTYFWFGEHKIEGAAGNQAHVGVHVYSSRDLLHWQDEKIALAVSDDPVSDIARGCILERPKVIHNARTGKFVMWFHLEPGGADYSGSRSGVAVADQPVGPFRYLGSMRPNAGVWPENVPAEWKQPLSAAEQAHVDSLDLPGGPLPYFPKHLLFRRDFAGGQMARDMTLFVDDDGTAFHIYASEANGTLHISQLNDDYLRPAGRYVRAFPGRFHEAPAMMKWRGRYFLITSGCTGWAPNAARVSVADSVWGPWEELETRVSAPARSSQTPSSPRAPAFSRSPEDRTRSFSSPTAGGRKTPSTDATSGSRSSPATASRPSPGATSGRSTFSKPTRRRANNPLRSPRVSSPSRK